MGPSILQDARFRTPLAQRVYVAVPSSVQHPRLRAHERSVSKYIFYLSVLRIICNYSGIEPEYTPLLKSGIFYHLY